MDEYTPGEWELSTHGTNIMVGDKHLAMLNTNLPEWKANAHLIVAAPDLLAACELALQAFELVLQAFETRAAIDWNVLSDAIAKARGQ